jgi:hypothetical protein
VSYPLKEFSVFLKSSRREDSTASGIVLMCLADEAYEKIACLFAKREAVYTENLIRVDDVMESPKLAGMIELLCFALAVLASPFKSRTDRTSGNWPSQIRGLPNDEKATLTLSRT